MCDQKLTYSKEHDANVKEDMIWFGTFSHLNGFPEIRQAWLYVCLPIRRGGTSMRDHKALGKLHNRVSLWRSRQFESFFSAIFKRLSVMLFSLYLYVNNIKLPLYIQNELKESWTFQFQFPSALCTNLSSKTGSQTGLLLLSRHRLQLGWNWTPFYKAQAEWRYWGWVHCAHIVSCQILALKLLLQWAEGEKCSEPAGTRG